MVCCMMGCYICSGKRSPFLQDTNRFVVKEGWPYYPFLLGGMPTGLRICTHIGRVTVRRVFPPALYARVVVLSGFHSFIVSEVVLMQKYEPPRGRRTMIMNMVNASANIGVEEDQNRPFIVNSLQPQLDAPITSMLSTFNAITFLHDAHCNETVLPNHARIHLTRCTAHMLDLVHANLLRVVLMLHYVINVAERVSPFHQMPLHGLHPIIGHSRDTAGVKRTHTCHVVQSMPPHPC